MKPTELACALALASAPAWGSDPASAAAAVPPPTHTPVFTSPADARPPIDWRQANEEVGRFTRGHIDLLRWEAEQAPAHDGAAANAGNGAPPLGLDEALRRVLALHLGAVAMPGMSPAELAQSQAEAARLTHRTRRAWLQAVAAHQVLALQEAHWDSTRTGTELAARMQQVGNWSTAQTARRQQQRNETGQALVAARQAAHSAREALNRELALWGDERLRPLPTALDEVPAETLDAATVEAEAVRRHPALTRLRIEADQARAAVDTRSWTQAQTLLREAAAASPTPVLDTRRLAWSHALERALRLDMERQRLAATVRSHAREAWLHYRHTHELALVAHPESVQLARQLEADTQQRYNGMLKSTWDLLDAVRARQEAEWRAIEARRDFWLAHNDLIHVLAGGDYAGPNPLSAAPGRAAAPQGH